MRIRCTQRWETLILELLAFLFMTTNSIELLHSILRQENLCSVHITTEKVLLEDVSDEFISGVIKDISLDTPVTMHVYDSTNLTDTDSEEDKDNDDSNNGNATTLQSIRENLLSCYINFLLLRDVRVLKAAVLQPVYATVDNTWYVSLVWNIKLQTDFLKAIVQFDSLEETSVFKMAHQKILFIKDESDDSTFQFYSWSVICYSCDIHNILDWRIETLKNLDEAGDLFERLNSQGYGRLAHIKAVAKLVHDVQCEYEYYFSTVASSQCDDGKIPVQVIESRFNITFEEISDSYFEDPDIFVPLILGQNINPQNLHSSRSQCIRLGEREALFFYCTFLKDQMYENRNWWFFLEPLDYYVWSGMLCTSIVISFIYRNAWFGLDIFVSFVSQRLQMKWSKFASAITILTTALTIGYQDMVTSSFIAPPGQKVFKNIAELITRDYRYVLASRQYIPLLVSLAGPKLDQITENQFSTETNLVIEPSIDQFNINVTARMFQTLAELKGTIVIYNEMQIYLQRHKLGTRENQFPGGVNCHIVPETFDVLHYNWVTRGILSINVIKLLNRWLEAGMTIFWYNVTIGQIFRSITLFSDYCKGSCNQNEQSVSLDSSVQMLMYWYAMFMLLCCVSAIGEVFVFVKKHNGAISFLTLRKYVVSKLNRPRPTHIMETIVHPF